jgi:hypothetical protein
MHSNAVVNKSGRVGGGWGKAVQRQRHQMLLICCGNVSPEAFFLSSECDECRAKISCDQQTIQESNLWQNCFSETTCAVVDCEVKDERGSNISDSRGAAWADHPKLICILEVIESF